MPFGTPFSTPFRSPFGTPFETPFGTLFGMSFKKPFGMSFKTLFRPLRTSFGTTLGTPLGTTFGTPFRTPFGISFKTPFETPFRTPFETPLWTPFAASFGTLFRTPFGIPFGAGRRSGCHKKSQNDHRRFSSHDKTFSYTEFSNIIIDKDKMKWGAINEKIPCLKNYKQILLISRVIVLGQSCLFICVFSKLCLKRFSQPTFFDRFFSYCTGITPRRFRIWFVVGVAIWRFLEIWRQLIFSIKKLSLIEWAANQLWRHNGFIFEYGVGSRWVRYSQPISIEGTNSQKHPS